LVHRPFDLFLSSIDGCDNLATIDIEDFVQNRLRPLLQKFKQQLSTFDDPSIALQEFTLSKIRNACAELERFDRGIRPMVDEAIAVSIQSAQQHRQTMAVSFVQALDQAMHDLNEKFRELEALSDGYIEKKVEDTIDATMRQIEEVDGRIAAAFDRAFEVRQRVGDKITEVAGIASGRMDSVKKAVADEARRLLKYDELPIEWRNNAVSDSHAITSAWEMKNKVDKSCYNFTAYLDWLSISTNTFGMLAFTYLPAQ
jgi:adiponectin receptor